MAEPFLADDDRAAPADAEDADEERDEEEEVTAVDRTEDREVVEGWREAGEGVLWGRPIVLAPSLAALVLLPLRSIVVLVGATAIGVFFTAVLLPRVALGGAVRVGLGFAPLVALLLLLLLLLLLPGCCLVVLWRCNASW